MTDRVEPILKLVPGVHHLYLSTSNSEVLDVMSAICSGAPLQTFLMDPLNDWRATDHGLAYENLYEHDDFASLIENCPDLQELGVYLVPLLFTQWDYTIPFGWSSSNNRSDNGEDLVRALVRASSKFPINGSSTKRTTGCHCEFSEIASSPPDAATFGGHRGRGG
jgi:hypothetical protein